MCLPPPQRPQAGACPGDARATSPLPAAKWQRGSAVLSSPLEVKPQSLCPFPRDGWSASPVAMIMYLEFDQEASDRKTYGVNLDALRLVHTREERHKALQAGPRPRAPRGPAARPKRQMLGPEHPGQAAESLALGSLSWERTLLPGEVGRLAFPGRVPSGPSPRAWQVLHN